MADFSAQEVFDKFVELRDTFEADPTQKGLDSDGTIILTELLFDLIIEGMCKKDLDGAAIDANRVLILNDWLGDVNFNGATFNDFIATDVDLENLDDVDASLPLLSLVLVENPNLTKSPNQFCVDDNQCQGARDQRGFDRNCLDNQDSPSTCDATIAIFSLEWLTAFIFATWGILIIWFVYMIVLPYCRRRFGKKPAEKKQERGPLSTGDQLMLNTLASQCATAENMLYRATEIRNYAKRQEQVVTVEARREARLLRITAQYFQTLAAITTVLAHKYLDEKIKPGQRLAAVGPDAEVRALQLEVLRYVKERLQLAMEAEAFTEGSLVRIGEAYAILKKVLSNIALIGFDWGDPKDKLQYVPTPQPDIDENAFFIHGVYNASNDVRGDSKLDGREVCVITSGADSRGIKNKLSADYFLSNSSFSVWNYNKDNKAVDSSRGEALVYNFKAAGTRGDSLKFFVRQFWGDEIASIQRQAAEDWMKKKDGVERFLERERFQLEDAVKPYLKRNKAGRRGRRNDEDDEVLTTYSDETGYTVNSKGTGRVYNAETIINLGLSVAGQAGIPYDGKGTDATEKKTWRQKLAVYAPNVVEWPKFHLFIYVIMPIAIAAAMLANIGKGSSAIDIDGNLGFEARAAGFGTSFLGCPNYYFLDGFVPLEDDLVVADQAVDDETKLETLFLAAEIIEEGDDVFALNVDDPFPDNGKVFISNVDAQKNFEDFNADFGRNPDFHLAEIQAGILAQENSQDLLLIQEQQEAQKVGTLFIYTFMHIGVYFFAILPFSLIRESWEILARRFPVIRQVLPLGLWRVMHMNLGLSMILYVTFGATIYVVQSLVAIERSTPFAGFSGDPNIADFFDLDANVLYLRMLLLPGVPLLLLMKYADRGPPRFMVKYFPTFITKWYYEMCYFFHFLVAITVIVMLVLYRPQVFYWVGASWGFGYGCNKILRIVRTKRTTINNAELITYSVEDKRNNGKKKTQVLRLSLNVPKSFPNSSRGQAVWIMAPSIDYIAHPFTIAKVPDVSKNDQTITLHIGIKYMPGDDIISYPKPDGDGGGSGKGGMQEMEMEDDGMLPPGWKQAQDPQSGKTYFYNSAFQRTTWTRPKANNFRALTQRFSTAMGYRGSTALASDVNITEGGARGIHITNKSTWTQHMAHLTQKMQALDADLRENKLKEFPVYVSAPLGTSFDDVLQPSLPGSVIIVTQNGLPAAEASVRWLLSKPRKERPKFFYFVSVSRQYNDALTILETLRNAICDAVASGNLKIDALDPKHSHMADWLGITMNLTQRKGDRIQGDRDVLLSSLNPPDANVSDRELRVIEDWLKHRVHPGRLSFGRFLKRIQEQVKARTGSDRVAVGYCGSSKVAGSIRASVRDIKNMSFDGEYI